MTDFPNGWARVLAGVAIMGRDLAERDYGEVQVGYYDPPKNPDEIAEYADGYEACKAAVYTAIVRASEPEAAHMVGVACASYRLISSRAYGFAPPSEVVGDKPGNVVPIKGGRA
ncbi:hypothetical protein ACT6QG_02125 [Xanthobacter sp. TB0136]|uniref:hypothetical protein n=1 Tax=Xanthobacter sp. TB0136 TaxID=3459177 RepID=UPI0040398BA0